MKNLIREMEKQFDERFEENKRFFEDTRNEGLANMKNFAKSFFQDYTERIITRFKEEIEKIDLHTHSDLPIGGGEMMRKEVLAILDNLEKKDEIL